jgi:hypothetical protein
MMEKQKVNAEKSRKVPITPILPPPGEKRTQSHNYEENWSVEAALVKIW